MPNKEDDPEDVAFRERIRDVIQANGKAPGVAKLTGIPLGTLNKYVAMRSIPSVTNAAKIARAVGVSLEELVTGVKVKSPDDGSGYEIVERPMSYEVREVVDPQLFERLYIAVAAAYQEAGLKALPHRLAFATGEVLNRLTNRVTSINDKPIVEAVIPVLMEEVRRELAEAVAAPGTGKRSAS